MEQIKAAIETNKKEFMLHNIVRLREMIRYLPQKKLELFREIPFLLHINSPKFPAYVKSVGNIFGVWNFQNSGFAKDLCNKNPEAAQLLEQSTNDPAVQGLYHIGSLGTFTQSAKSDFDFWIIIDNSRFDAPRLKALHEKLNLIIVHSRKQYDQEVSFFVHDAANLMENQFDEGDEDELITVPRMLIKEEFYRTFIMVAGKIPLWAILPLKQKEEEAREWRQAALANGEFIDLGTLNRLPVEEIQRGLLWQICKAHYDPVKSVIKATVTASYLSDLIHSASSNSAESNGKLLCDSVKAHFSQSIIDDYAADPYILAFERALQFCDALNDPGSVSQIKVAIFFRLCGFPLVILPPQSSPKRMILDRYIRQWQLSNKRLKKLLAYQSWPESEKNLFESTMIKRLSALYRLSLTASKKSNGINKAMDHPVGELGKTDGHVRSDRGDTVSKKHNSHPDADAEYTILQNKARKIMEIKKGRIPTSSIFLRLKPHPKLILVSRKDQKSVQQEKMNWLLFSQQSKSSAKPTLLYASRYVTQVIGWAISNHIYVRGTSTLTIRSSLQLSTSFSKITDIDEMYLNIEPWLPLSDAPFASPPHWEKIVVMLPISDSPSETRKNKGIVPMPHSVEILARNSWGEIFFDIMSFDGVNDPDELFQQVARKIIDYHDPSRKEPSYSIFQFASRPHPEAIRKIKTIVEDTKLIRKADGPTLSNTSRRPYLDRI